MSQGEKKISQGGKFQTRDLLNFNFQEKGLGLVSHILCVIFQE